jgi:hypothetical protein
MWACMTWETPQQWCVKFQLPWTAGVHTHVCLMSLKITNACVCVSMYVYTYKKTYIHYLSMVSAQAIVLVKACMHACMCVYMYICILTHTHLLSMVSAMGHVNYTCRSMYACMCVCIFVYIYIYTHASPVNGVCQVAISIMLASMWVCMYIYICITCQFNQLEQCVCCMNAYNVYTHTYMHHFSMWSARSLCLLYVCIYIHTCMHTLPINVICHISMSVVCMYIQTYIHTYITYQCNLLDHYVCCTHVYTDIHSYIHDLYMESAASLCLLY